MWRSRCRPSGAKELVQPRFYTDAVPTGLKRFLIHTRFLCKTRWGLKLDEKTEN